LSGSRGNADSVEIGAGLSSLVKRSLISMDLMDASSTDMIWGRIRRLLGADTQEGIANGLV
jgi:hypothetical protein